MTLPFGIKTPDVVETGHATSAPEKPMLRQKIIISTVIALVLLVIIYWVIDSGYITLSQL